MIPAFTFFGLPGSGKSTQRHLLTKEFGFAYLSAGEMIREAAKEKTKLGREIKARFIKGQPQSDDLAEKLVVEELERLDLSKGIVFDNYPFNKDQMKRWEYRIRGRLNFKPLWGIYLKFSPEAAIKRLGTRRFCPQCHRVFRASFKDQICPDCLVELKVRADDQPKAIRERIKKYQKPTKILREYFKKKNRLIEVDGNQSINEIFKEIKGKIKHFNG